MRDFKETLNTELAQLANSYEICGIVDRSGCVYPLGADTKVLSTIFELVSRPAVYAAAKKLGLEVFEAEKQNHYPDFTICTGSSCKQKIAVDVKTTYRKRNKTFRFTLGSYTSFIRGTGTKNILFPFTDYAEHWVIGFAYDRVGTKKAQAEHMFDVGSIEEIPTPFDNVEYFLQEKWKIASKTPGSGNTANIGSITGSIQEFRDGGSVFASEEEFLAYWRSYGT
jgi:Restriction endonuclease EcoRV.